MESEPVAALAVSGGGANGDIVSVSAGLELLPGVKDARRIQLFMEAVLGSYSPH